MNGYPWVGERDKRVEGYAQCIVGDLGERKRDKETLGFRERGREREIDLLGVRYLERDIYYGLGDQRDTQRFKVRHLHKTERIQVSNLERERNIGVGDSDRERWRERYYRLGIQRKRYKERVCNLGVQSEREREVEGQGFTKREKEIRG